MTAHLSAQGATVSPVQEIKDLNCHSPHPVEMDDVERLQQKILSTEKAQRMAEFFSLLGDTNRLRIISVLAIQELCVCDLAAILDMSESAVSHQLRALRALRLVRYHKRGRKVFYHLQDNHVLNLYKSVAEHLEETDSDS
ncbi:ArsR/SmtB family transcription factor [Allocoleopsis franciscana]|uniref:Putative transcriptional regulator n=1 Tax=Allocoleopsis franciscana PCC 7113 TaxID=1173027 RepID=K9WCK8_9CYAN|nr:metalloregulator ArsR/SmtB family transcription factor [Allocoleopsis franciscana]AFZ17262.1 putative transcriptional regulator [Allocoleopsis franciscana PCC 7113]